MRQTVSILIAVVMNRAFFVVPICLLAQVVITITNSIMSLQAIAWRVLCKQVATRANVFHADSFLSFTHKIAIFGSIQWCPASNQFVYLFLFPMSPSLC